MSTVQYNKPSLEDFRIALKSHLNKSVSLTEILKHENIHKSYPYNKGYDKDPEVQNLLQQIKERPSIDLENKTLVSNYIVYAMTKLKLNLSKMGEMMNVDRRSVGDYRNGRSAISATRFLNLLKISDPDLYNEIVERIKKYDV